MYQPMDGVMLLAFRPHRTVAARDLPERLLDAIYAAAPEGQKPAASEALRGWAPQAADGWLGYATEYQLVIDVPAPHGRSLVDGPFYALTDEGRARLVGIEDAWTLVHLRAPKGHEVIGYIPKLVTTLYPTVVAGAITLAGVGVGAAVAAVFSTKLGLALVGIVTLFAVVGLVLRVREVRANRRANPWYWLSRGNFGQFRIAWKADLDRRTHVLAAGMRDKGREIQDLRTQYLAQAEATMESLKDEGIAAEDAGSRAEPNAEDGPRPPPTARR